MNVFQKLFLAISSIHLFLLLFDWGSLAVFTKPLLLLFLFLAVFSAKNFKTKTLLLVALIFSWMGDVLLMFTEHAAHFFILGLIAFLISHVLYIVLFTKQAVSRPLNRKILLLGVLFVLCYLAAFLTTILPYLGELQIPVIVYGLVISLMLVSAIKGALVWIPRANLMLLFGAIAFVASDSLLAFDKFYSAFDYASVLIMLTYLIAQYLISIGILKLNSADQP
jgi:uncharacterized membrane protein YhhN